MQQDHIQKNMFWPYTSAHIYSGEGYVGIYFSTKDSTTLVGQDAHTRDRGCV